MKINKFSRLIFLILLIIAQFLLSSCDNDADRIAKERETIKKTLQEKGYDPTLPMEVYGDPKIFKEPRVSKGVKYNIDVFYLCPY